MNPSRKNYRLRVLSLLLVVGIVAAACGDDSSPEISGGTDPSGATATTTASNAADVCTADRVGGTLTYAAFGELRGLDPIVAAGTGLTGTNQLSAMFSPLMRYRQDTGVYEAYLAKSVDHNADYTVWTIKLRPGVKYGNGDVMTAADVKWNFERTMSEANKTNTRRQALAIKTIDVPDTETVVVTLNEAGPDFGWLLSDESGMIVNPRIAQSMPAADFNTNPKGAGVGPYELVKFAPGDEVVFKAKSDYWGGPVCVQTLRFVVIQGAQGALDALKRGEVDVAWLNEPKVIKQAKDASIDKLTFVLNANLMIVMNSASGVTADPRIRKAVAAAIDPVLVDQRVNDGTGLPTSNMIHPSAKLNPGVDGPKYDLAEAKRLVAAVKAEGKWDGSIKLISHNIQRYVDASITVQGMLEAAGFKVNFETPQAVNEIVRRVTIVREFELSIWGLAISDVNPWGGLSQLVSTSPTGYFGYKVPAFDTGVQQLQNSPDVASKKKALAAIQTAWTADPPVAVLGAEEEYIAYGKRVHGLSLSTDYFLFDQAYVK